MTSDPDALLVWTRDDVLEALRLVVGPVAGFITVVAVFLLGLAVLRDLGRL
jgi:type IV secretory pathway VirB2 component (pilin)